MTANGIDISIAPPVLEVFPEVFVGGFAAAATASIDWNRGGPSFEASSADLEEQGVTLQNLTEAPRIAGWREALGRCGLKPSTYKSSPEQLARRLLKQRGISTPLPLVDAYCAVSVRNLAPMGGYDLDRLPAPMVTLRGARPGVDRFEPLGGRAEDMPLDERVVVYGCADEVICWAFNHRDSRRTSLRPETNTAVFFTEAVNGEQRQASQDALEELAGLLESLGAGVGPREFIDSTKPEGVVVVGES